MPRTVESDFETRIEYYFNFAEVRPVFQLVPCSGNVSNILTDDLKPGWHNHSWTVKRSQCKQRPKLTYNIILHDENDVFAWSSLEIRPVLESATTPVAAKTTSATIKSRALDISGSQDEDEEEGLLRARSMDEIFEETRETGRLKRHLNDQQVLKGESSIVCKPESCDRTRVDFPDFFRALGCLDDLHCHLNADSLADPRYSFFLNTKNRPLSVVIESPNDNLTNVDVCLEFYLFMDPSTSISLKLDDNKLADGQRLLEKFDRAPGHRAAGAWETIRHCMSDYSPRLVPIEPKEAIRKLQMILIPQSEHPTRDRIMVEFFDARSSSLRELAKPLKFLANAVDLDRVEEVEKMWVIDRGSLDTTIFKLTNQASESEKSNKTAKVLLVEEIEETSDYFDLASRWIQIDEKDLLDNSTMFDYKFDKADWIKSVDFSYQREPPDNEWHTEEIYRRESSDKAESSAKGDNSVSRAIKLKSVSSGKGFRLRLRHYVDRQENTTSSNKRLKLTIRALSLGDACTHEQTHCQNGGQCRPIGTSKAACVCLPGFSGKHCEETRPCETIHVANMTGAELCRSVGAQCAENIPVFRCIWPEDIYYHCRTTGAAPAQLASINLAEASTAKSATTEDESERLQQVESRVHRQSGLIFVLSVMLTIVVFVSVISIVNLAAKLRKSRSRLETAQVGVHELTRQFRPGSSSSSSQQLDSTSIVATSRAFDSSKSFKAFNNRGFDADT